MYLAFIDESGDDPKLKNINKDNPYFAIGMVIVRVDEYFDTVCPEIQRFKYDYFGHSEIVFHGHKIAKGLEPYNLIFSEEERFEFIDSLGKLLQKLPFQTIASVIDKQEIKLKYPDVHNVYDLGVKFCLERFYNVLSEQGLTTEERTVIFESRGAKDDEELKKAFDVICDFENYHNVKYHFRRYFSPKSANSIGLQLADLVTYPIRRFVATGREDKAFQAIKSKIRSNDDGNVWGYGIKKFP